MKGAPLRLSPYKQPTKYRDAHAHHYGRQGVMPDYVALSGPDYEDAVRDNVWSDRNQEQRIDNLMRKHAWKERVRYIPVSRI